MWAITGCSTAATPFTTLPSTRATGEAIFSSSADYLKILEDTLNLRDVRIYDTKHDADGRERRVLNSKETTLAQQKQQAIRDAFRDWIWRDPDRRHTLVARYNELFNSTRPREYDGISSTTPFAARDLPTSTAGLPPSGKRRLPSSWLPRAII